MSYIIYLSHYPAYNAGSTYNVDDSEYGKVAVFLFFPLKDRLQLLTYRNSFTFIAIFFQNICTE